MKKGMKLMVMTLVVAMLLSMSAFAATVSYTSLVPEEINDGADYSITVNYSATGYNTGDQVTLLVLTEDDEIIFDTTDATKPTNVAYIDQATIAGETGSFTFTVAKSFITSNDVYVKLGATAQATAAGSEALDDFISGPATGGDTVLENGTNATVSNVTAGTETSSVIAGVYTVAITDTALAGKVPQAYVGDTAVGTVFFSTERNKYLVVIPAGTEGSITMKAIDVASATVTNFVYGDTNGDGLTAAAEVNMATAQVRTTQSPINTAAKILALDVNADGNIAPADVNMLTAKARGVLAAFPITAK